MPVRGGRAGPALGHDHRRPHERPGRAGADRRSGRDPAARRAGAGRAGLGLSPRSVARRSGSRRSGRWPSRRHGPDATPPSLAALDDDAAVVRTAAATALSERAEAPAGLLDLLATGSGRTQAAALRALRGHGPEVRQPVIDWTLARLDRATDLRQARRTLAMDTGPAPGPVTDFLSDVLWQGERRSIARSLGRAGRPRRPRGRRGHPALPRVGRPGGPGAGDRGARLDRRPRSCPRRSSACSRTTPRACDFPTSCSPGWRMMTTRGSRAWPAGSEQEGRTCPRRATSSTTSRRCCRCGASRSSRASTPRTSSGSRRPPWSASTRPGEALVREGDVGDELVVIVEGSVRVVHLDPDGTERPHPPLPGGRPHRRAGRPARGAPRRDGHRRGRCGVRGLVIGGDGAQGDPARTPGRGDGDARDPRRTAQHARPDRPWPTRPPRGPTCRPGRSPSCARTSRARWGWPARSGTPGTSSTSDISS